MPRAGDGIQIGVGRTPEPGPFGQEAVDAFREQRSIVVQILRAELIDDQEDHNLGTRFGLCAGRQRRRGIQRRQCQQQGSGTHRAKGQDTDHRFRIGR
jgi:hypothetical protein